MHNSPVFVLDSALIQTWSYVFGSHLRVAIWVHFPKSNTTGGLFIEPPLLSTNDHIWLYSSSFLNTFIYCIEK